VTQLEPTTQTVGGPAPADRFRKRMQGRLKVDPTTGALVALFALAALLLLYAGRNLTFFYDEWTFVVTRRGSGIDTYLAPHNGHLSLFPVVVYKLLFATVGLRHYTPYRIVATALHLLCGAFVYVLARRRIGPVPALVPTALLLLLGTAYQDLLWPFQIGYLGSIAGGLGAFVLLDRRSTAHDGWAAGLLVWAVVSSGVGIAFSVACGVMLVAQRARWQRLWIVALPLLVYAAWYAGWGGGDQTSVSAVLGAPEYVADAAAAAVAGLAGLNDATWGPPLALALFGLIVLECRRHLGGIPTPMLLAAAAGALTFWLLVALARATEADPAASRYVYIGAVFILLAAAEVRLGVGLRGWWLALGGVLLIGALVGNIAVLRSGERGLRSVDDGVRASLSAVQVAAPVVSPAFSPDPVGAPQLTAGTYLAAVRALGSPALTLTELENAPETTRETADGVLVQAERLSATRAASLTSGGAPPSGAYSAEGRLSVRGACDVLTPTASQGSLGVAVDPGATLVFRPSVGPPVAIYARRFADSFGVQPLSTLSSREPEEIRFPADRAPGVPWHVLVLAGSPVTVCAAG
jgi:hypothetical protein